MAVSKINRGLILVFSIVTDRIFGRSGVLENRTERLRPEIQIAPLNF